MVLDPRDPERFGGIVGFFDGGGGDVFGLLLLGLGDVFAVGAEVYDGFEEVGVG